MSNQKKSQSRIYKCGSCGSEDVTVFAPEFVYDDPEEQKKLLELKGDSNNGIAVCNERRTNKEPIPCGWVQRFKDGKRF